MDTRVRYTKNIIQKTMIGMLSEMPIEKISVRELCARAEINRSTFYKHYDNPYDLLDKMFEERLDLLEKEILKHNPDDFKIVFRVVLQDIQNNFSTYQIMFTAAGDDHFRKRLFDLCYSSNMKTIDALFPELDTRRKEWLYYFIAEGSNRILHEWMDNGMKEEIEEVIAYLGAIVSCLNQNLPGSIS